MPVALAVLVAGCQSADPGAGAPAPTAAATEASTADAPLTAPAGYPTAPATAFPDCDALAPALSGIVPAGFALDTAVSEAQDQEDVAVERTCAWVAGDEVLRLTVSGIAFTTSDLLALGESRLTVPHPAANARGLFVMGVGEPPQLEAPLTGTLNVFDQFHTVSIGWSGATAPSTAGVAADAAVAVHEILRAG